MKLTIEQLPLHLTKELAPIYLISSDEVFLAQEAAQLIRETAYRKGFQDKKIFYVETGFLWENFLNEIAQQSLFGTQTFLELRIDASKFIESTQKALAKYQEQLPKDKILLIITEKLDTKHSYSHWYKQLETNSVIMTIWPLQGVKLQRWLQQRCQQTKVTIAADGLQLLQELTEGNLAAAAQAIEKLSLTYGDTPISAPQVAAIVSDSSHFDIFALVDAVLIGDIKRALSILTNLKNTGTEPTIILWALLRELRNLIHMAEALRQGQLIDQIFSHYKIWESKKTMMRNALQKNTLEKLLPRLQQASHIDHIIKGAVTGNVWLALSEWCLQLCK